MDKRVLVAVSGGPDSMYLLDKTANSFITEPVVVHVNYHLRDSSDRDEQIVKDYCDKHKIKYFIKQVTQADWDKFSYLGNKQSMAREIRYTFFQEIANRLGVHKLLVAHQKDDFLETAIMQEKRSKKYLFYGIEKKSIHHGLNIYRPFIKTTKDKILDYLKDNKINFGIDETNEQQIYERNKVRANLMFINPKEKRKIYKYFKSINKSNEIFRRKVNKNFAKWNELEFNADFLLNLKPDLQEQMIYKFFISSDRHINITEEKLKTAIEFIQAKHWQKHHRVMENMFLVVKDRKVKLEYNSNLDN